MAKLTLSIDEAVVKRAKALAAREGTSVSQLVEQFLRAVSQPPAGESKTPVLDRLEGILEGSDPDDYWRHIEKKYLDESSS